MTGPTHAERLARLLQHPAAFLIVFEAMREALELILPMAKGYAKEHPVGSNQPNVDQAVFMLAAAQALDTHAAPE